MSCTRDGRHAYVGGNDGRIRVWDLERGEEIGQFGDHRGCVLTLALSPTEKRLASAGADGTIRIWDLPSHDLVVRCHGHTQGTDCVVFAATGPWVASVGGDGAVRAWDTWTGERLRDFPAAHQLQAAAVAIAPDDKWIVSGGSDRSLRLWDVDRARAAGSFEDPSPTENDLKGGINHTCLRFLAGGTRVASLGGKTVRVWDLRTGKQLSQFDGADAPTFAISSDGSRLAYQSGQGVRVVALKP